MFIPGTSRNPDSVGVADIEAKSRTSRRSRDSSGLSHRAYFYFSTKKEAHNARYILRSLKPQLMEFYNHIYYTLQIYRY